MYRRITQQPQTLPTIEHEFEKKGECELDKARFLHQKVFRKQLEPVSSGDDDVVVVESGDFDFRPGGQLIFHNTNEIFLPTENLTISLFHSSLQLSSYLLRRVQRINNPEKLSASRRNISQVRSFFATPPPLLSLRSTRVVLSFRRRALSSLRRRPLLTINHIPALSVPEQLTLTPMANMKKYELTELLALCKETGITCRWTSQSTHCEFSS